MKHLGLVGGLVLLACIHPTAEARHPRFAEETVDMAIVTLSPDEVAERTWRPALRPTWRDPTREETAGIQTLVPALLAAATTGRVPAAVTARAVAIGMVVERWNVAGHEHLALVEAPESRHGAGAYLFAVGRTAVAGGPWVLLEAPHAYFDVGTGRIAAALYFTPPPGPAPLAFFTNTLHRYTQADGTRQKRDWNPADACHNREHLLAVATTAAANAVPNVTVVQLHGFSSNGNDAGDPPAGTASVVSAGRADGPTPLSRATAASLRAPLGEGVRLFPVDAQVLGATTNVEMKALSAIPATRFVHIELAPSVRDTLLAAPDRLAAFANALLTTASTPDAPDSP